MGPTYFESTINLRSARSLGLTLITNNTREFRRVRNLAIENWTVRV